MKMIGVSVTPSPFSRCATEKPMPTGIQISMTIRSGRQASASLRPRKPSGAINTAYPAASNRTPSAVAIRVSSSTINILFIVSFVFYLSFGVWLPCDHPLQSISSPNGGIRRAIRFAHGVQNLLGAAGFCQQGKRRISQRLLHQLIVRKGRVHDHGDGSPDSPNFSERLRPVQP